MSVPDLIRDAAMPAIDLVAVRALRFEIGLLLDEMAGRAADVLEAVGMARTKLEQLERAYEGREGARTATLTAPTMTDDDTE